MSALTGILVTEVRKIEETAAMSREIQKQRLTHHLMPPTGWLNDPNGLCYFKGRYHVFFQYAPFDAEGGLKFWGHYSSDDLVSWRYEGVPLYPDSSYDCMVYIPALRSLRMKSCIFFLPEISKWMGITITSITGGRPVLFT